MRESAAIVCDVWCDTFEKTFPLRLLFEYPFYPDILSFYTTLLLKLLVVEQETVLSATVGHLVLGLDTNVRISKEKPFLISVIPDFR